MSKGGRYLDPSKAGGMGRGKKILVIVLLVLVLLIGGVAGGAYWYVNSLLGHVNQAEYNERNQDLSFEDIMAELANQEAAESGDEDTADGEEDDGSYIPDSILETYDLNADLSGSLEDNTQESANE